MPARRGLDRSTVFHVYNRGVDRQDIFSEVDDLQYFEALLRTMVEQCGVRIHAFALMSNHYHLIVESVGAQLSQAMHLLGRGYAVWYNRASGRSGPLFEHRFGAIPIESDEMLQVEGRYVHRNPLSFMSVETLGAYAFSSFGVYIGRRTCPDWLTTSRIRGDVFDPAVYERFVKRPHPGDSIPQGGRPALIAVTADRLDDCVAREFGVHRTVLTSGRAGVRNDARVVALALVFDLRILGAQEAAARYGYASARSARNAGASGRARIHRSPQLGAITQRILLRLATRPDGIEPG